MENVVLSKVFTELLIVDEINIEGQFNNFNLHYSSEPLKSRTNKLCLNAVSLAETHESGLYFRTLGARLKWFTTVAPRREPRARKTRLETPGWVLFISLEF